MKRNCKATHPVQIRPVCGQLRCAGCRPQDALQGALRARLALHEGRGRTSKRALVRMTGKQKRPTFAKKWQTMFHISQESMEMMPAQ
eukprot:1182922-Prorocentrum_minimum.AAC.2